jgi:hypothetical protein
MAVKVGEGRSEASRPRWPESESKAGTSAGGSSCSSSSASDGAASHRLQVKRRSSVTGRASAVVETWDRPRQMWLERRLDLARNELDRRLLRARSQSLEALDIGREEGAAGRLG